jgi:hypothetical protein
LGETKYGQGVLDDPITEREAIDYVLDTNGIVQYSNALIRPISPTESGNLSHNYILVLRSDNLNSTTHALLAAGTYDAETMNQYATYPRDLEPENGNDLLDLITEDPSGYQETETNEWPNNWDHPLFGYGPIPSCTYEHVYENYPGCNCTMHIWRRYTQGKKYFLGIRVQKAKSHLILSSNGEAEGCPED